MFHAQTSPTLSLVRSGGDCGPGWASARTDRNNWQESGSIPLRRWRGRRGSSPGGHQRRGAAARASGNQGGVPRDCRSDRRIGVRWRGLHPNSGVLVFPKITNPAARCRPDGLGGVVGPPTRRRTGSPGWSAFPGYCARRSLRTKGVPPQGSPGLFPPRSGDAPGPPCPEPWRPRIGSTSPARPQSLLQQFGGMDLPAGDQLRQSHPVTNQVFGAQGSLLTCQVDGFQAQFPTPFGR